MNVTGVGSNNCAASASPSLKGSLGTSSIVFMVVATAAPLTVMVANTPLLISMGNGAAAPLDALVATFIMLLFTVGFVTMAKYITTAGAFYACIQRGLGRTAGLGAASLAVAAYFFILLALEAYFGFAMSELVRSLTGFAVPWWGFTLLLVAGTGWLGYRHIELSSKFLAVALVLEIAIVMAVNIAVLAKPGSGGYDMSPFSFSSFSSGSPGLGILFAIFSFIGFESTVIYREEVRDPARTIPRATYITVLSVGGFYVLSMWCEVIAFGADDIKALAAEHPGNLYLMLTERYLGKTAVDVMQVLLVTSLFACILSLHNIIVRYQYILGTRGVLPKAFREVHAKHGAPSFSSLVQTVYTLATFIVLILFSVDPVTRIYAWGATAGTIGYMVILTLASIAVIAFFSRFERASFFKAKLAPAGGLVGIATCLWVAISNLPALVGGEDANTTSFLMIFVIAAAFFVGCLGAVYMRLREPARYRELQWMA